MATTAPTRFCTDYAKRVAKCQKCKMQLEKGVLRMGKIVPNFFVAAKDSSKPPPDMKQYFHKNCLFEMLFKARPTTKVIEETDEIEGFDDLNAEDQVDIKKLVEELMEKRSKDGPAEPKTPKTPRKKKDDGEEEKKEPTSSKKRKNEEEQKSKRPTTFDEESAYNSFHKFIQICAVIKDLKDKSEKSEAISQLLQKKKFDGDLLLWLNFLIRNADKRKFPVTDEQLIKHFGKILDTDEAKLQKYVTKSGDIALSIGHAHDKKVKNEKCGWSLQKIDRYLDKLAGLNEEDAVLNHLKFAAKKMRNDEVEMMVRIIRKELDTEADAKTILKGVHAKAFGIYEEEGMDAVVENFYNNGFDGKKEEKKATAQKSKKSEEPKAKKSRREEEDSDESDDSDVELSDSEAEDDDVSDSDAADSEEISGSDSDDVSEISSEDEDEENGSFKENSPKKAARGTRSRPRGTDGTIVKKEECPEGMEACRYGTECYRKNKEHKEQFWHPAKN